MHNIRLSSLSQCLVFSDFDNTITTFDVLDDIIKRFSVNKDWMKLEKAWQEGKIGSRQCLQGQLRGIRISKPGLLSYLSRIKIDPHFYKIYALFKREGLTPVILSDNFTFIIKFILRNNGIKGMKVFANNLSMRGRRLLPSFPYINRRCRRCAHCKKKNLLKKGIRDKIIMYIGDGLSDTCPAENADIVFAKGRLLKHFRKAKRLCLAFRDLDDIYNYFRGLEK
jgi:2,3-diketo-5-methylthio-1-phosphopentane phosphatase